MTIHRADSARLSPDQRFRGVAAILATGVVRLRQRTAQQVEKEDENSENRPRNGLEVPAKTRLSVRVG